MAIVLKKVRQQPTYTALSVFCRECAHQFKTFREEPVCPECNSADIGDDDFRPGNFAELQEEYEEAA